MGEPYDLSAVQDSGTPDGVREAWQPGDLAWFEYHCLESNDSADARLWHRSHQQVAVLGRGEDEDFGQTFLDRADAGMPNVYRVRFADGFEGHVFEDELLTGPEHYSRPDPPDTRPCAVCGTWTCSACGWKRHRAAIWRPAEQSCAQCGSREGTMAVSWHRRRTWEDHMFGLRAAHLDFPAADPPAASARTAGTGRARRHLGAAGLAPAPGKAPGP